MTSRSLRVLIATSASAALLASADASFAYYPDAKIDTQIKPDFGLLLKPPLKNRHRPHKPRWRRGSGYGYGPGYSDPYPPYGDPGYPTGGQSIVTVDCANPYGGGGGAPVDPYAAPASDGSYGAPATDSYSAPPADSYGGDPNAPGPDPYGDGAMQVSAGPISDAVRQVAPGGTVYVRGGAACKETIVIDRSVTIAGEPSSAFSEGPARRPQLTPPPSAPCIRVLPNSGKVEIRDLDIESIRGGAASCVETWDSSVALVRTRVRYTGDGSAIYAAGGKLIVRESSIDAKTYDAALVADGADFEITRTRIRGEAAGLDLTAGAHGGSLDGVKVHADSGTPGGVGVLIRGLRSGSGRISIRNVLTRGWRVGVQLERGANADINRSRILDSNYGVISDYGDLGVYESAIGADQIGIYAAGGRARIMRNRIFGVRGRGIRIEPGTDVVRQDNWIQQQGDWRGCAREDGEYCNDFSRSFGYLQDEGRDDAWAFGWSGDGYESGYMRDGVPHPVMPPPPPKRGWRR